MLEKRTFNTRATFFASPARSGKTEIKRQAETLRAKNGVDLLNAIPEIILVLNANRQVVFGSSKLLELLDMEDDSQLLGMRPGEIFQCEQALASEAGCGTGEACRYCGAVQAIMSTLDGKESQEECRILKRSGPNIQAYDLKVSGSPVNVQGEGFVLFVIQDISHEKRRRTLERLFFHDILNTAGGLRNLAELFKNEAPDGMREDADLMHRGLTGMVEEIVSHKLLLAAECEELVVQTMRLESLTLLDVVRTMGMHLEEARGKELLIDASAENFVFASDYTLLRRSMLNLVKNGLEASQEGRTVTLGCRLRDGRAEFLVHNQGAMSKNVQMQLFQRSFSTKGPDRGLGTYSVRLLVENYLQGEVSFESNEQSGTTFRILLPMD